MVQAEHDVALQDTDRLEGRAALVNNVKAAVALAGAVRSTLGPRGLDKMLVSDDGNCLVTNDGVILCDDYDLTYAPGVKKAINDFVRENNFNLEIFNSRFAEIKTM